jgi:hypothetical protein
VKIPFLDSLVLMEKKIGSPPTYGVIVVRIITSSN